MKKFIALGLTAVMILGVTGCGSSGDSGSSSSESEGAAVSAEDFEPLVLKMGNQQAEISLGTTLDKEMCERIAEETEGRITIELYPNQALGDYTNMFDELMLGTLDIAHISPVETYDTRVSATMLPYISFNSEELVKVYSEGSFLREELNDALSALGIHLSGIFLEGYNGITNMTELKDPTVVGADKGCIIRSPMMDVYSLEMMDIGFRVSSMPYSDTYTAMQTGVVSGLAGASAMNAYLSFRDIMEYFYDYKYNQEATMIMFSQKTWDKILPEDQEIIQNIVNDICVKSASESDAINEEYMAKMEEEGLTVVRFSDEELEAFAKSSRENVWPQLAKNYPDGWLDKVAASLE